MPSFFNEGFIFLKLTINSGLYGVGEPNPYSGKLDEIKDTLNNKIFPLLKNKNFNDINLNSLKKIIPIKNSNCLNSCIAAISQALNDIKGKEKKIPVFKLLSKKNFYKKKIRVYASGGMIYEKQDYKSLIEEALRFKEERFVGWKFRPKSPNILLSHIQRIKKPPPFDVKKLIKFSEELRLKVGKEFKLMLDLGCRCRNLDEAKYIIDALSEMNFFFLEEPLRRNDPKYLLLKKFFKNKNKIKIAGGEFTSEMSSFNYLLNKKIFDIIQPDANMLTSNEISDISKLALRKNINIIPHNWCNAINEASNLHYFSGLEQNNKIIEYNVLSNPFKSSFINNSYKISNGCINFFNKPGLGIEIDFKSIMKLSSYEKKS